MIIESGATFISLQPSRRCCDLALRPRARSVRILFNAISSGARRAKRGKKELRSVTRCYITLYRQIALDHPPRTGEPGSLEFYQYAREGRNQTAGDANPTKRCNAEDHSVVVERTRALQVIASNSITPRCRRSFGVSITFRQTRLKMSPCRGRARGR